MNRLKTIVIASITLLCVSADLRAQTPEKVVQVTGVVLVGDSLYPVPYVGVVRTRDQRGTYADKTGYFTLPALAGDTLEFFMLGLKNSYFIIPNNPEDHNVSMVQVMESDTIMLPTAYILPYPAPHHLRREVALLDLPNDGYNAFTRNLASIANYDGMNDFSQQSYENASSTLNARYNAGFKSGGNLLDPAAWSRFLRSMK